MRGSVAYQAAVVVGRWQLAHLGHLSLVKEALAIAPKVLIVVGSSFRAREPRNPFNWQERVDQLSCMLSAEELERIEFLPVRDYFDHDRWNLAVRQAVSTRLAVPSGVVIVGHKKDFSSYYLDHFPEWATHYAESFEGLNASDLRAVLFDSPDTDAALQVIRPYVHPKVHAWLAAWCRLPFIEERRREFRAVNAHKKLHNDAVCVEVSSLLQVGSHVLLERHEGPIGQGLLALPTGTLLSTERTMDCALRTLRDRTGLRLLGSGIKQALISAELLDDPMRSPLGRTLAQVVHFRMGEMASLPEVLADRAYFMPISQLIAHESNFFADHFMAVDRFLGLLPTKP